MQGYDLAKKYFDAAMNEATACGFGRDAIARYTLQLIVHQYLETRSVADVQSELRFIADNCDPETDYMFMRP